MLMRIFLTIATLAFTVANVTQSNAGVYSDDFGKCLIENTSDNDREVLMLWIVVGYTHASGLDGIVEARPDALTISSFQIAQLFERLIVEDCVEEGVAANKYEGDIAFQLAFEMLGKVAGQQLMSDKSAEEALFKFLDYIDFDRVEAIYDDN